MIYEESFMKGKCVNNFKIVRIMPRNWNYCTDKDTSFQYVWLIFA